MAGARADPQRPPPRVCTHAGGREELEEAALEVGLAQGRGDGGVGLGEPRLEEGGGKGDDDAHLDKGRREENLERLGADKAHVEVKRRRHGQLVQVRALKGLEELEHLLHVLLERDLQVLVPAEEVTHQARVRVLRGGRLLAEEYGDGVHPVVLGGQQRAAGREQAARNERVKERLGVFAVVELATLHVEELGRLPRRRGSHGRPGSQAGSPLALPRGGKVPRRPHLLQGHVRLDEAVVQLVAEALGVELLLEVCHPPRARPRGSATGASDNGHGGGCNKKITPRTALARLEALPAEHGLGGLGRSGGAVFLAGRRGGGGHATTAGLGGTGRG